MVYNILKVYESPYPKIRIGNPNGQGGYIIANIPTINYDLLLSGNSVYNIAYDEKGTKYRHFYKYDINSINDICYIYTNNDGLRIYRFNMTFEQHFIEWQQEHSPHSSGRTSPSLTGASATGGSGSPSAGSSMNGGTGSAASPFTTVANAVNLLSLPIITQTNYVDIYNILKRFATERLVRAAPPTFRLQEPAAIRKAYITPPRLVSCDSVCNIPLERGSFDPSKEAAAAVVWSNIATSLNNSGPITCISIDPELIDLLTLFGNNPAGDKLRTESINDIDINALLDKYETICISKVILRHNGDTMNWFNRITPTNMAKIKQMVINVAFPFSELAIEQSSKLFEKINEQFILIHLHGDNCCDKTETTQVPHVFECTYLNKNTLPEKYTYPLNQSLLPDPALDRQNMHVMNGYDGNLKKTILFEFKHDLTLDYPPFQNIEPLFKLSPDYTRKLYRNAPYLTKSSGQEINILWRVGHGLGNMMYSIVTGLLVFLRTKPYYKNIYFIIENLEDNTNDYKKIIQFMFPNLQFAHNIVFLHIKEYTAFERDHAIIGYFFPKYNKDEKIYVDMKHSHTGIEIPHRKVFENSSIWNGNANTWSECFKDPFVKEFVTTYMSNKQLLFDIKDNFMKQLYPGYGNNASNNRRTLRNNNTPNNRYNTRRTGNGINRAKPIERRIDPLNECIFVHADYEKLESNLLCLNIGARDKHTIMNLNYYAYYIITLYNESPSKIFIFSDIKFAINMIKDTIPSYEDDLGEKLVDEIISNIYTIDADIYDLFYIFKNCKRAILGGNVLTLNAMNMNYLPDKRVIMPAYIKQNIPWRLFIKNYNEKRSKVDPGDHDALYKIEIGNLDPNENFIEDGYEYTNGMHFFLKHNMYKVFTDKLYNSEHYINKIAMELYEHPINPVEERTYPLIDNTPIIMRECGTWKQTRSKFATGSQFNKSYSSKVVRRTPIGSSSSAAVAAGSSAGSSAKWRKHKSTRKKSRKVP